MLSRRLIVGILFFNSCSLAGIHMGTNTAFTLCACSGGLSAYLSPQTSLSPMLQPRLFPVLDHQPDRQPLPSSDGSCMPPLLPGRTNSGVRGSQSCSLGAVPSHSILFFFFKILFIYLFILREKGRERDREGEKYQCVVASYTSPTGDLACNPGMSPGWESNQ